MTTTTTLRGLTPQEKKQPSLMTLLQRLWPEAQPTTLQAHLDSGDVLVDERPRRQANFTPEPGTTIEIKVDLNREHYGMPEATELARGEHWLIVDKPIGMPGQLDPDDPMDPILFMADLNGYERDHFRPLWPMPHHVGGPWVIGTTAQATALGQNLRTSPGMTWVVITPRVGIPRGRFSDRFGSQYEYNAVRMNSTLSELHIHVTPHPEQPATDPVNALLDALQNEGYAVLGDRLRGGHIVDGGMRLRLAILLNDEHQMAHSWTPPKQWWPQDPIALSIVPDEPEQTRRPDEPRASQTTRIRNFTVSSKTLEVLNEGHQWALDDKQTDRRDDLTPGTIVQLQDQKNRRGPFALIEGPGNIAARVWSTDLDDALHFRETITHRLNQAFVRRTELIQQSTTTTLFRLIHAEADGLPGFYLDRIGPILRATVTSHAARAFKTRIYANLMDLDPDTAILEVAHLEDVRSGKKHKANALPQARVIHMKYEFFNEQQRMIGLEDDLRYWCEPWEGIDTGFFADQRENRRILCQRAQPGQRWLNLFGHTGAFSVALAKQGAHVINVDVSKRYLNWTEDNFRLNQLDMSLNEGRAEDARAFLAQHAGKFDGIIVDPPTAAKTQSGFWSVRKDYADLLVQCFEHLNPDGVMLVCRNDRKRTQSLDELVQQAADDAKWSIDSIINAPPSSDYPSLPNFPESTRFEGRIVSGR